MMANGKIQIEMLFFFVFSHFRFQFGFSAFARMQTYAFAKFGLVEDFLFAI